MLNQTIPLLHVLSELDIPGLIELSSSVEWDYNAEELRTVLAIGTVYGHKNEANQLVSCAAVIPYEDQLATIGMVIVHSSCRGLGLGRSLMKACMEAVPLDSAIMLIATKEGQPLYESMGFVTVDTIHKSIRKNVSPLTNEPASEFVDIVPMKESDLTAAIELDALAVGSKRSAFLYTRMQQAKTCLVIKDQEGTIVGFGFAVQGPINLVAGPIVARNSAEATSLLCKLTEGHEGHIRIDVPDGQEDFLRFLAQNEFEKASQPPVMIARANSLPPRSGHYFGIGAQIFG
ncbi:acetyltransferase [Brevibacillus choshinensis]|uniref:Acetyltransferase n=1 Tax=Brevibacillus choshinensis TaxID=54911 RepID=A0ABR5NC44_BRECH|nr:GNAT family N-acetyltransferase [Brevibacillus choshinensis]KQL48944.1 acetyltransferase [Brevibacillus choshinensis]